MSSNLKQFQVFSGPKIVNFQPGRLDSSVITLKPLFTAEPVEKDK